MYKEFKESIIRLMQHPIMSKPLSALTDLECQQAYELIQELVEASLNEEYTQIDYLQMARLNAQLGNLAFKLNDLEKAVAHYNTLPQLLEKAGINLSLKKWMELVSLCTQRIKEEDQA